MIFTYPLPLVVLRYTLYPEIAEPESVHVRLTMCDACTPVPESVIVAGDPVALLAIEMLLFTVPVAVGSNVTESVSFCEGAKVTGAPPPLRE